jgi:hypothetical protein
MAHRRSIAVAVAVALVATAILRLRAEPDDTRGFAFPDAYHYADIGRQIARGDGLTTLQTYPYVLAWLRETGVPTSPPWPNVTRFPLLPLVYAPYFRVAGADEDATRRVGEAFWVATAVATFVLGAALFGAGPGLLAAGFQVLSLTPLGCARAGLPDLPASLAIVLAALGVASLTRASGDPARPTAARARPVALGLLLGLAFLLRYDLLALLPAALAALVVGRGAAGRRDAALVVAGCAIPMALWLAHDARTTGVPGAYLGLDRNLLGGDGMRDVYAAATYESPWSVLRRSPDVVTGKLAQIVWPVREWRQLFGWRLAWLGPLSIAAVVGLVRTRHAAARVALFTTLAFVLRSLIFTVTHHEGRFHASFAPLLLVLTVGGASALAARSPLRARARYAAATVACVLLLAGFATTQVPIRQLANAHRFVVPPDPTFAAIRARLPKDVVLASSRSESVAWLGDRAVVNTVPDLVATTERLGVHIDGMLYPSSSVPSVERALARQGLAGEFVQVSSGPALALWLRRPLVPAWQEPALVSSRE